MRFEYKGKHYLVSNLKEEELVVIFEVEIDKDGLCDYKFVNWLTGKVEENFLDNFYWFIDNGGSKERLEQIVNNLCDWASNHDKDFIDAFVKNGGFTEEEQKHFEIKK